MFTLFGLILIKCLYLEAKLFGDHVCQTEIIEPQEVFDWELKNRTMRTYQWCMNVPPRCSVYSHKVFNETKISVINATRSIETCCEGFHEQNSYCISMCEDCKNGLCLKGTCICQSGWDGVKCDSRILSSNEEITLTTIQTPSSSKINYKEFSTAHDSSEFFINITSTTMQVAISDEDIFSMESNKDVSSSLTHITPTGSNANLKENTVSSSTNYYSSSPTTSQDFEGTNKDVLNSYNGRSISSPPPNNSFEFNKSSVINYATNTKDHGFKMSGEESTSQYSTDRRFFDTTATQQTIITSSVSTDEEIFFPNSKELSKETSVTRINSTYFTTMTVTTPVSSLQYPKDNRFFDATVTHQTEVTASVSIDNEEMIFSNSEETTGSILNFTYSDNNTVTIQGTSPNYPKIGGNPAHDVPGAIFEIPDSVDYRELGGQSIEEKSMESPKVMHNGFDRNDIQLSVSKTTKKYNGFRKDLENIESGTKTTLETITPVLDKPNVLKDEKENSISKDDVADSVDDLTEERYQRRSSNRNYSQNTLLTKNETDNNNLIYSVCAASATTILILIVAIILFTLRSARKKLEKDRGRQNVPTVAMYTTSIFHSPLPDPPTFENPTYLSTVASDDWNKEPNDEMIEVQEFNVVFQKTLKNPKIEDCKQYLYDHPPSTGSYRASSDIDTLSQYNLSHKSLSGIILEPVYDEIPSRDIPVVDENDENNASMRNSMIDSPRDRQSYVDSNSLYVNTFGRTKF